MNPVDYLSNPVRRGIPKNAVMRNGVSGRLVTSPMEILEEGVLGDSKWTSLSFYRRADEAHIAGVDFELLYALPPEAHAGKWYWPQQTPNKLDFSVKRPRYRDFRDAAIVSLQMHPEALYVTAIARGNFSHEYFAWIRVRSWFDDPDYVAEGTAEAWWRDWVSRLVVSSAPVLWLGSDDSLR